MNFYICCSLIFALCVTAVFPSTIPENDDYNSPPKKRNFVKDLEESEKDEMSKFALSTLNSLDPTYSKRILCRVLEGQKQFASGIVYRLKLSVVVIPDEEYKSSANSQLLCSENEEKVVCEVDVLRSYAATDYSPVNAQVIKSECGGANDESSVQKREARHVVGGITKQDPNSPEAQELATRVVAKLDADSGSDCKRRWNKIIDVTTQVVAGLKSTLKMEICPDSCNGDAVKANEANACRVCTAHVWEKSWENFLQVTSFECEEVASNSQKASRTQVDAAKNNI